MGRRAGQVIGSAVSLLAIITLVTMAGEGAGAAPQQAAPQQAAPQEAAAGPPAEAPAAQSEQVANCLMCHEDDGAARTDGTKVVVKPAIFEASIHGGLSCVDCHQDLAAAELPHAEKLQTVDCATCHTDAAELFTVSAHARARANGSTVAASCANCHGSHDIKPKSDAGSRTHHLNVATMCALWNRHAGNIRVSGFL